MARIKPVDYETKPVDTFTIAELTDALSVEASAELLSTSRRAIYTVRNTNVVSYERLMKLIKAVKADEATCRRRLVILQHNRRIRADRRDPK
jgi:hypothetical protein